MNAFAVGILLLASPLHATAHAAARPADPTPHPPAIRISLGTVSPGVVTTSVVSPGPEMIGAGGGAITFRIEPLSGTRIYGELEGTLEPENLDEPLLPITFSVPRLQLSGPVVLARVDFSLATGAVWSVELAAEVASDYRLELEVRSSGHEAEAGGEFEIRYSVLNVGNVTDSVAVDLEGDGEWLHDAPVDPREIVPAGRLDGTLRVNVPATARPGDRLLLRLVVRGRGTVVRSELLVSVAFPEQPANYELPIRFFAGASGGPGRAGDSSTGWSLTGGGEVASGTNLALSIRAKSDLVTRPAFVASMAGPSFWASIRRNSWDLALGEIMQGGEAVTGGPVQGQGSSASLRLGRIRASGTFVRDQESTTQFGSTATGDIDLGTPFGQFGLALRSDSRTGTVEDLPGSLDGVVATFSRPQNGLIRIDASAGAVRVAMADATVVKPVAHADISRYTANSSLSFRIRRTVPEASLFGARSNELFLGGALELGQGFGTSGWFSRDDLAAHIPGQITRSTAASAGVRYGVGQFQAMARGALRSTILPNGDSTAVRRPAAALDLAIPFGPVTSTLTLEKSLTGQSGFVDYAQASLRHMGDGTWTSLTGTYARVPGAPTIARLDLVESLRRGRVQFDLAGGGSPTEVWRQTVSAWAKAEVSIAPATTMIVGVEYAPLGGSAWPMRFSIGFGRALSVPLPTRRPAALSGVAFHDLDGDGARDPEEPGFSGLGLRQGLVAATTGPSGAFELRGAISAGALSIDPQSLPSGFVVPSQSLARIGRGMEIPVVGTAGLSIALFFDTDGDGARGEVEGAAPNAVLTLTHDGGVRYTEQADDAGGVRFTALPSGRYTGVINAEGIQPHTFEITLATGAHVELAVPVRKVEREIRFGPQGR